MRHGDDGHDERDGSTGLEGFDELDDSGPRTRSAILDRLPDPRDGLTRVERVVLWQLRLLEDERGGRDVPTVTLYGRVVEHVHDLTERELSDVLARLGARRR